MICEKVTVRYFPINTIITAGNITGMVRGLDKVRCRHRVMVTKVHKPRAGLQLGSIVDVPFGEGTEVVAMDRDYADTETAIVSDNAIHPTMGSYLHLAPQPATSAEASAEASANEA